LAVRTARETEFVLPGIVSIADIGGILIMGNASSWISFLLVLFSVSGSDGGQPRPDDNGVIHGY
jgi:hypothetical protein